VRLARAELADQGDDRAGEEEGAEPTAEGLGGIEIGDVKREGRQVLASRAAYAAG
jgi:hypothetical protein